MSAANSRPNPITQRLADPALRSEYRRHSWSASTQITQASTLATIHAAGSPIFDPLSTIPKDLSTSLRAHGYSRFSDSRC